jgi:hypothetical protein
MDNKEIFKLIAPYICYYCKGFWRLGQDESFGLAPSSYDVNEYNEVVWRFIRSEEGVKEEYGLIIFEALRFAWRLANMIAVEL